MTATSHTLARLGYRRGRSYAAFEPLGIDTQYLVLNLEAVISGEIETQVFY